MARAAAGIAQNSRFFGKGRNPVGRLLRRWLKPADTLRHRVLLGEMSATYDTIGINYSDLRKPDRRIERMIGQALGTAETVLNVGAGAGSYEPADRQVTAVEPSEEMIRQRPASAAPAIQGFA